MFYKIEKNKISQMYKLWLARLINHYVSLVSIRKNAWRCRKVWHEWWFRRSPCCTSAGMWISHECRITVSSRYITDTFCVLSSVVLLCNILFSLFQSPYFSQGKRDETTKVNEDQAHKDAETLIEVQSLRDTYQFICTVDIVYIAMCRRNSEVSGK